LYSSLAACGSVINIHVCYVYVLLLQINLLLLFCSFELFKTCTDRSFTTQPVWRNGNALVLINVVILR